MITRYPPRLVELVERSRALAHQVLSTVEARAAFLGGAPLAGLGTPKSDVDLHVVMDSPPPRPGDQVLVDGHRVDLRYWSSASLADRVQLCTGYTVTDTDQSQLTTVGRRILDPVVRLVLGDILVDDGTLAGHVAQVRAPEAGLVRLVVAALAGEAENHVEDAEGFLEVGEHGAAGYVARQALLVAAEAYLAARGDVYLGQKWVWTRWARTVGDDLGSTVTEMVTGPGAADPRQLLWLAQDLLVMAATGWTYQPTVPADPQLPQRDPFAVPLATDTSVLLLRPGRRTARVSLPGTLLWAVAHGRNRAEAVDLAAQLLDAAGRPVPRADIDAYYATFAPVGLLRDAATVPPR